jgi:hypothetical protein
MRRFQTRARATSTTGCLVISYAGLRVGSDNIPAIALDVMSYRWVRHANKYFLLLSDGSANWNRKLHANHQFSPRNLDTRSLQSRLSAASLPLQPHEQRRLPPSPAVAGPKPVLLALTLHHPRQPGAGRCLRHCVAGTQRP